MIPIAYRLKLLMENSGVIMMTRLAGAGIGFLTQFLLVKLIGPDQLGLFYAGSSLAAVLGVITAQGYTLTAARFVGRYRNKKDHRLCGTFTGHTIREGMIAAVIAAVGVAAWAVVWPGLGADARLTYVISGGMILAITAINILTNIAAGMRLFALCYVPEGLGRPMVFFVIIVAAGLLGVGLSAVSATLIFAGVTTALAIYTAVALRRSSPPLRLRPASSPVLAWRWRREAWQLIFLAIFTNFFTDVGILAVVPFLSSVDVAVFGLCLKLALLVGYFVQVGQQMAVPDMVDARHAGDHERVHRAAWRSIAGPSSLTLAGIVFVYLFGRQLLGLFGEEFTAGYDALLILLLAQLLRALAGPSAHLLTLSGIQSINMGLSASAIVVLLAASAVLSPAYGIEGAAGAVLVTYAYWIGVSAIALRWLEEPSVDVLWLGWQSFKSKLAQA